jgi:hypothetical protein
MLNIRIMNMLITISMLPIGGDGRPEGYANHRGACGAS